MADEPTLQQTLISYACAVVGGAIVGGLVGVWLYMSLATNTRAADGRRLSSVERERRADAAEWARHDRSAPGIVVFGGAICGAVLAAGALYKADPVGRRG